MGWVFTGLFAAAAVLVAAAWGAYRRRMVRLERRLTDDDIRRIEAQGRMEAEEPLDLQEAAEEEERFWGESWDEPEPF